MGRELSKKPLVSIYTIADFGKRKNLKTDESKGFINGLKDHLFKVYCRIPDEKDPLFERISLLGTIINKIANTNHKIGSLINRMTVMDYFAAKKKDRSKIRIFIPYNFNKSITKSNKEGAVTIAVGTSIPGPFNKKLYEEELEKMGLDKGEFLKKISKRAKSREKIVEGLLKAKHIITYSEFCKEKYVEMGFDPKKIHVVPLFNTIDNDEYKEQIIKKLYRKKLDRREEEKNKEKTDELRVITVANAGILKGLRYLVKAWIRLLGELRKEDKKRVKLIIIGSLSAESRETINQEIGKKIGYNEYDEENRLIMVGKMSQEELKKEYLRAAIFVLPSLTDAWGKVVTEAMAFGTVPIISENTGAKNIIINGKNGYVVPIRDDTILKRRIKELILNKDQRLRMGEEALKTAKHYDKRLFEKNIRKVVKKICYEEGLDW